MATKATPPPRPASVPLHDDGWYGIPINELVARYDSDPEPDPPWPAYVPRPDLDGERKIRGVTAADPDVQELAGCFATKNGEVVAGDLVDSNKWIKMAEPVVNRLASTDDLPDLDKLIEMVEQIVDGLESNSFVVRCIAGCHPRRHEPRCRACAAFETARRLRDQLKGRQVSAAFKTAKELSDRLVGLREERGIAAELAARDPDFWYAEYHRRRKQRASK